MKNESSYNWKEYKKEAAQLIGAVVFSVVLVGMVWNEYQDIEQEKLVFSQKHAQLLIDVEEATEDKTVLKDTGNSFKNLKDIGFYGKEDRLALTEALKNTADQLKLPRFKYAIAPQQKIDNVGSGFSRKLSLLESVVNIEAELPHDGDFVQLGEDLSSFAEGAFIVKSCELSREKILELTEVTKNVGLTCAFVFYTVEPASSEGGEDEEVEDIDLGDAG